MYTSFFTVVIAVQKFMNDNPLVEYRLQVQNFLSQNGIGKKLKILIIEKKETYDENNNLVISLNFLILLQ